MTDADPYAADARYYDVIHGRGGDDIGLWQSFAGRTDRPVLEVGTGTGRIGIALARDGHTVVGVDPSPAMLATARSIIEEDALDTITLLEGRLTSLALEPEHFGLVLVPADVFLYCSDTADQLATLRFAAASLAHNGRVALD
ncbi:MAG: class I SAM-dependent methyltransferase, partial [Dehalococcoidia bacterium]